MKKGALLAISVTVLFLMAAASHAVEKKSSGSLLDGKTFAGTIGKKGEAKGDPDNLVFQNGKFRSTACDKYGFGDAVYKVETKGDVVTFEAETTSPTDGRIKWSGTVKGSTLDGNFTWYPPEQGPVENWVKAELKK